MDILEIKTIGVLGAGLMGHSIAQCFASKGYKVNLFDRDQAVLDAAPGHIRANFEPLLELNLADTAEVEETLGRIKLCRSFDSFCNGPDYVIEAISERLEVKKKVFADLEANFDEKTILATNTSAIPITDIAAGLSVPERVVGNHCWNPPHIVPCVEIVKGEATSEATMKVAVAIFEKIGMRPVRVEKDAPGFIGNRMQHALWREAIHLIEEGIASPQAVDDVVRYGFGLRLALLGPLETADLAGLDLSRQVHGEIFPHLNNSSEPSKLLDAKVASGELGAKSGKGFYQWPEGKLAKTLHMRDTALLQISSIISETLKSSD